MEGSPLQFEFVKQLKEICSDILDRTIICILSTSVHPKDTVNVLELEVTYRMEKPLKKASIDKLLVALEQR